jgi:curved DNA-binding protein CbpA
MPKFSYYLNDDDTIKEMDHFKALQLPDDFKNNFNLEAIRSQYKKLVLMFHPDRNSSDTLKAKICFQRIAQAYEVLSDPKKRQHYLQNGTSEFHFDVHFNYQDINAFFAQKISRIDELLFRLEQLNRYEFAYDNKYDQSIDQGIKTNSLIGTEEDSLEQITLELADEWKGTMVLEDLLQKQFALYNKINALAKTSGEFYALYLVAQCDPMLRHRDSTDYLHAAASQGHLISISIIVAKAFAGHYTSLKDSIVWALNGLRYLEETVIPILEREQPTSPDLIEIKNLLHRVRERRNEVLPATIPSDQTSFDTLVDEIIEYRKRRGGEATDTFNLSLDMFSTLNETMLLDAKKIQDQPIKKPVQEKAEKKIDKQITDEKSLIQPENNFMKNILDDFSAKINVQKLKTNPNTKAIGIAEDLLHELENATDAYYKNLSDKKISADSSKTIFIDSCTNAITKVKPVLEQELGWGDYLNNLLKGLVNAIISTTNSITKSSYTLFTYAKAPLVSEVDEVEKNIKDQMPNPKL